MRTALATVLLLVGCSEPREPGYLRLDEPAPVLADAPGGEALLVSFWASWCAPCVEELPSLARLAGQPPAGVKVLLVSVDGRPEAPAAIIRMDPDGQLLRAFGVDKLPSAFVLRGGRLVARFDGPRDWSSAGMRKLLGRLAAEKRGPVP